MECEHEIHLVTTGSRRFVHDEVVDNLDTVLMCVKCGEVFDEVAEEEYRNDKNDKEYYEGF